MLILSGTSFDPSWNFKPMRFSALYLLALLLVTFPGISHAQCDTAWFLYPAPDFCKNGNDPEPIVLGTIGGTFSALGPLALNPTSGKIDLSQSVPGTYGISYATPGPCPDTAIELVEIRPADNAWFQYTGTICENGPNPIPTVAVSGGRFTSLSGALRLVDPFTGEIALDSTDAGTHLVRYTTNGICPADSDIVVTVQVSPAPGFLIPDSAQIYCEGDPVSVLVYGGDRFAFYLNDSLLRGLSESGNYDLPFPPQNGDQLRVLAVNQTGECEASDTITMNIAPAPHLSGIAYPSTISNPDDLEIFFVPDTDNTVINWSFEVEGQAVPMDSSSKTPSLRAGSYWRLHEGPKVVSPTDPVTVHFKLRPQSGGCFGHEDSLEVLILPSDNGVFIPSVITPNGNGKNDVWEIRYERGVNPADYSLQVFNRSGGLVYEQNGLAAVWSGEGLAPGTYWYLAWKGRELIQKGGLVIKRD